MSAPLLARTGCDLVRVPEIEESIAAHGERYLRRVFTARELADTAGRDAARRLAARFAAKEAVVKALRLGEVLGPWTQVEVVSARGGGLEVHLHPAVRSGAGGEATDRPAASTIDVSVSHDGDLAMAVAVVLTSSVTAPGPRLDTRRGIHVADTDVTGRIRTVLTETAGVGDATALGTSDDLYTSGLTSHASVNVMLALEDEFDVEFPDELLRKSTFASIGSIEQALEQIGVS